MATEERFQRVLENLNQAALGDVEWASVAGLINDMIRTNGHSVTYAEAGPGGESQIRFSRFFVGTESRDDLKQLYYRDYFWRDEAIPRLYGIGDRELVHKSDLYTDQEKRTSAAYNEFRCVNNTQNGFFMGLDGLDGDGIVLSFGDSTERRGWGHDQIQAVRRLAPHLRRFARVRGAMADARALGASLGELLETRRLGIIQLDRCGRILEANDRARYILLKRDGARRPGGCPGCRAPGGERGATVLARAGAARARRSGRRGLDEDHAQEGTRAAGAGSPPVCGEWLRTIGRRGWRHWCLSLTRQPDPRVDADLATEVLGLTPAESLVAVALTTGQTVAGIAHARGCAESTVRSHVKRVYRKLGIRKQTELVRRILSLEGLRKFFPLTGKSAPSPKEGTRVWSPLPHIRFIHRCTGSWETWCTRGQCPAVLTLREQGCNIDPQEESMTRKNLGTIVLALATITLALPWPDAVTAQTQAHRGRRPEPGDGGFGGGWRDPHPGIGQPAGTRGLGRNSDVGAMGTSPRCRLLPEGLR